MRQYQRDPNVEKYNVGMDVSETYQSIHEPGLTLKDKIKLGIAGILIFGALTITGTNDYNSKHLNDIPKETIENSTNSN